MAKTHREIFQHASRRLQEEARFAGLLDNPGAKGDARELALREVIRPLLGATFAVAKGEIIDANGGSTPEYDAVIYDATTGGPLCTVGDRDVLRVESAVAIVEVKSRLDSEEASKTLHNFAAIWALKRHYHPGALVSALQGGLSTAQSKKFKEEGVPGNHRYEAIPPITTAIFAFDGPTADTAHDYCRMPGIDLVCVLGKYTFAVAGEVYPYAFRIADGDDALGAFCSLLEEQVYAFNMGRSFATPDFGQYFTRGLRSGK